MRHDSFQAPPSFTITVKDLWISEEKRSNLERAADDMATKADSLGYLDPLEAEPDMVFEPTV